MFILICLIILFFTELLYFKIAFQYKIIDEPNTRSSHSKLAIRGGGIIFPIAAIFAVLYTGNYYVFAAGLLLLSLISFIDDISSLPSTVRSIVQLISVVLLLWEADPSLTILGYLFISFLIVGTINAWNFMDGINGITGGYSLITVGCLYIVNNYILDFTDNYLLLAVAASLMVFNFFNFRSRAKCFAGDVGSVSAAFIICFLLLQLIVKSGNLLYIGFLLVYGLDATSTMVFRLIRKENVFEAHRTHFYQLLANEKGWSHLAVSGLYMMIQLLINAGIAGYIIGSDSTNAYSSLPLLFVCILGGLVFLTLRWLVEGKKKLIG